MTRITRALLVVLTCLIGTAVLLPSGSRAQSVLPSVGEHLVVSTTPQYPKPGESFTTNASALIADLSGATYSWYVDNKQVASGVGLVSIPLTMGPLGSSHILTVLAQQTDGTSLSGSMTLRPSIVSLAWEADSYTPPWYRGRALPSSDALVHFSADVWIIDGKGNVVPHDQIFFTWKKNGNIVSSASGIGKDSLTLTGPQLYGEDVVSVTASYLQNSFSGTAQVRVPETAARVVLYRISSTGGVDYTTAIADNALVHDSEITLVAEPYFIGTHSRTDKKLSYTWEVNNAATTPEARDSSMLTLALDKTTSASASVTVNVANTSNDLQSAHRTFHITLGGSSGAGASSAAGASFFNGGGSTSN